MADSSLYVSSMQALSTALEKAIMITQIRRQIRTIYAVISDGISYEQNTVLDAFLKSWQQLYDLKDQEVVLKKEFVESLNKSIDFVLNYIITLDIDDINDSSITDLQKHLQLLHEVITASYSEDNGMIVANEQRVEQSLIKLDSFADSSQLNTIKQKVKQLVKDIESRYVGS